MAEDTSFEFESFDARQHNKGNGNVIFVRGKNCPITVLPLGKVLVEPSVTFDEQAKRNRRSKPGDEKSKAEFLFNGIGTDGKVRTYVAGPMVIEGIKTERERAKLYGRDVTKLVLEISTTGSGLETKYVVKPAADQAIGVNTDLAAARAGAPRLEDVSDKLYGEAFSIAA